MVNPLSRLFASFLYGGCFEKVSRLYFLWSCKFLVGREVLYLLCKDIVWTLGEYGIWNSSKKDESFFTRVPIWCLSRYADGGGYLLSLLSHQKSGIFLVIHIRRSCVTFHL